MMTFDRVLSRFTLLTLLLGITPRCAAQVITVTPQLNPNDLVRVQLEGSLEWIEGSVVSLIGSSLRLDRLRGMPDSTLHLDLNRPARIEVGLAGPRGAEAVKGAFLGALIVGGVSGVLGLITTECTGCEDPGIGVVLAVPGAVVGALVGGLMGAGRRKTDWVPLVIVRGRS